MNRIMSLAVTWIILHALCASALFAEPAIRTTFEPAAAADPMLVKLEPCPSGSKRPVPWLLYEDRDGDGYYDYVTAGGCDGTTKGRPLGNVMTDPFAPTPDDSPLGRLPQGAIIDSVAAHSIGMPPGGSLYTWTVTEYYHGTAVCSYSRTASGALTTTCPDGGEFGALHEP